MTSTADESTRRYYEERADEYVARTGRLDLRSLYEPFLALVPPGGTILDAGCGPGRDVQTFLERGYQVVAIDASARMVELVRQRTGLAARQRRFQEIDDDQAYDGIWACASLLHVPSAELDGVLAVLRRALKGGGVGFVSFKQGDGERVEDGRRFLDFTEASLRRRLEGVPGWSVVRVWTTDDEEGRAHVRWVNALVRRDADPEPSTVGT